ncbi:hypothetical protein BX600DRAFT_434748 [Xylariales sp. PMI_506]|nr:hypothetical protein BX600DRAFT_434748 [Xylariales sp. PMI_506]
MQLKSSLTALVAATLVTTARSAPLAEDLSPNNPSLAAISGRIPPKPENEGLTKAQSIQVRDGTTCLSSPIIGGLSGTGESLAQVSDCTYLVEYLSRSTPTTLEVTPATGGIPVLVYNTCQVTLWPYPSTSYIGTTDVINLMVDAIFGFTGGNQVGAQGVTTCTWNGSTGQIIFLINNSGLTSTGGMVTGGQ